MSAVELHARLEAHEPPEARGVPATASACSSPLGRAASSTAASVTCRGSSPGRSPRRQHVGHPSGGRAGDARRRAELELRFSPCPGRDPTATGSWSYAARRVRAPSMRSWCSRPRGADPRPVCRPAALAPHLDLPAARDLPRRARATDSVRLRAQHCRSPPTRTSTQSPAAPRCRARGDPSRPS